MGIPISLQTSLRMDRIRRKIWNTRRTHHQRYCRYPLLACPGAVILGLPGASGFFQVTSWPRSLPDFSNPFGRLSLTPP